MSLILLPAALALLLNGTPAVVHADDFSKLENAVVAKYHQVVDELAQAATQPAPVIAPAVDTAVPAELPAADLAQPPVQLC